MERAENGQISWRFVEGRVIKPWPIRQRQITRTRMSRPTTPRFEVEIVQHNTPFLVGWVSCTEQNPHCKGQRWVFLKQESPPSLLVLLWAPVRIAMHCAGNRQLQPIRRAFIRGECMSARILSRFLYQSVVVLLNLLHQGVLTRLICLPCQHLDLSLFKNVFQQAEYPARRSVEKTRLLHSRQPGHWYSNSSRGLTSPVHNANHPCRPAPRRTHIAKMHHQQRVFFETRATSVPAGICCEHRWEWPSVPAGVAVSTGENGHAIRGEQAATAD